MLSKQNKYILFYVVIFCSLALNTVSFAAESREICVSAAASLKNVMEAIGKKFEEKNHGEKITFNFGASGALLNQIIGGAPVDIFFSADIRDFGKLGERKSRFLGTQMKFKSLLVTGYPKPFVRNQLVFIIPGGSQLSPQSLADLKKKEWEKIAVGNPKTVPAGRYAAETIKAENLTETLKDRLVLCETVRQVLDYVIRGEVEGGFVYQTDANTAKQGEIKQVFVIPPEKHSPIVYGLGIMIATSNADLAEKFLAFIAQPECQEIVTAAGFLLPEK
ncbi:MAG: molybdate ABC transporter substrate-binding protein [Candidatus Ozemobacteraceae bacterium]